MARFATGDTQGLDELMRRYGKHLYGHLSRMVRNRNDAADLVLESFIRVFRYRARFNYELRFSSWLYTIASNLALNLLRGRSRQPQHVPLPESIYDSSGVICRTFIDPSPTPSEWLEKKEWKNAMGVALQKLPPKLRRVLILIVYEDLSQAQTAARLRCSIKTVEMRLYHGRKRLCAELRKSRDRGRNLDDLANVSFRVADSTARMW